MNSIVAMAQTLFKYVSMNAFQAFTPFLFGCSVAQLDCNEGYPQFKST